jgi:DNA polymerase-3 subunit delta
MPIISPESLDTALTHKKFDAVYLLFGEEEFLIEEALDRILTATVDEETRSFNFDLLYGSEVTVVDVLERANSYPLMADRRVVVVKEIDRTFALRGKPGADSEFARYMKAPLETTVLVMTAATGDVVGKGKSGAKAPYDLIVPNVPSVQFKKVYDRDIPSWVATRLRARGKEITPEAVELFIGYVGGSLRTYNNEIEKLITVVEGRKKIVAGDVQSVVGTSKIYNIFELQKAVGTRNLELAIEITERMLRAGESEQLVVTMLTRYFSILWRLVELRSKSRDQNEMARGVGISPFFINEYLSSLARYPMARIRNAFDALLQTDVMLKTTRTDPALALQLMLIEIVGE